MNRIKKLFLLSTIFISLGLLSSSQQPVLSLENDETVLTQNPPFTIDFTTCGESLSPEGRARYLRMYEVIYATIRDTTIRVAQKTNIPNAVFIQSIKKALIGVKKMCALLSSDQPEPELLEEWSRYRLENDPFLLDGAVLDSDALSSLLEGFIKTLSDTAFQYRLANSLRDLEKILKKAPDADVAKFLAFFGLPDTELTAQQRWASLVLFPAIFSNLNACVKVCCTLLHNELVTIHSALNTNSLNRRITPLRLTREDNRYFPLLKAYYELVQESPAADAQPVIWAYEVKFLAPDKELNVFLKQLLSFVILMCDDLIQICEIKEKIAQEPYARIKNYYRA